jgi:hypothetical protein
MTIGDRVKGARIIGNATHWRLIGHHDRSGKPPAIKGFGFLARRRHASKRHNRE